MNHAADAQPQERVDLTHPFRVTLCQIIIDRNHVNALALERIQIGRQRRDQRLSFTGFHLGDAALMQNDAADDLYLEMLHADTSPRRLTADRKRLRQKVIQRFAACETLLELRRLGLQLFIGQCCHLILQRHNLIRDFFYFFYLFGIEITKDLFHKSHFGFLSPFYSSLGSSVTTILISSALRLSALVTFTSKRL